VFLKEILCGNGSWFVSGWDNTGFDDELDEGVRKDNLLTGDFKEGRFDSEGWELLGKGHGLIVLSFGKKFAGDKELLTAVFRDGHELLDCEVVASGVGF